MTGSAALILSLLFLVALPSPVSLTPSEDDDPAGAVELPHDLLPPGLPLEVNDRVEREMRRFLADPDGFQAQLDRKARYASMMREQLRNRGMPQELLYLALVESGYRNRATSGVEAAGVWQIMEPTAVELGLRVDGWVDERRDPVRSTAAALDYLESLYQQFGSWYLAAAAYNCGPGRLARSLHLAGDATGEEVIWKILHDLPPETRQFIPRLVAASILAGEPERFGFRRPESTPEVWDQVFVPGGTSLLSVSRAVGVPTARLVELNPHLTRGVTPPGISYPVRVPPGETPRVVASLAPRRR